MAPFPRSPFRTGKDYRRAVLHEVLTDAHGVTDERAHWHRFSNPLCREAGQRMPSYAGVEWGLQQRAAGFRHVQRVNVVGMRGYYAGPGLHLLEGFGLEDPLLARLPMQAGTTWRIGHFPRPIPAGYIETLTSGQNHIADPAIARYYDQLALVTRSPIWSAHRFATIVKLNTHRAIASN
jgi:arabinofuranosyltransferase